MESLYAEFTSFPPAEDAVQSDKHYDTLAKTYANDLTRSLANAQWRDKVLACAEQLLAVRIHSTVLQQPRSSVKPSLTSLQKLDPAVNTIGYINLLVLLNTSTNMKPALLDANLEFLLKFDPVQIRYVGDQFLSMAETILNGSMFPVRALILRSRLDTR